LGMFYTIDDTTTVKGGVGRARRRWLDTLWCHSQIRPRKRWRGFGGFTRSGRSWSGRGGKAPEASAHTLSVKTLGGWAHTSVLKRCMRVSAFLPEPVWTPPPCQGQQQVGVVLAGHAGQGCVLAGVSCGCLPLDTTVAVDAVQPPAPWTPVDSNRAFVVNQRSCAAGTQHQRDSR